MSSTGATSGPAGAWFIGAMPWLPLGFFAPESGTILPNWSAMNWSVLV
jgi:hypothetical protein